MTGRERFNKIVETVLAHEGGYVNDPVDPGKETRYGISKRSYPHLDIQGLTIDQAKDIYYRDWWLRLRLNEIQDDRVAGKVLDTCVNVGARTGIRLLQLALHTAGQRHVVVDGIMGPQTIQAVNQANPELVLGALRCEQANHYRTLIKRNPKLARFERGWMTRAYS
ncbi:MAG: hypothetical protein HPY52_10855 [Firmicutes bacterium]|nr:hypothetical protein [Bacillota bacterium]